MNPLAASFISAFQGTFSSATCAAGGPSRGLFGMADLAATWARAVLQPSQAQLAGSRSGSQQHQLAQGVTLAVEVPKGLHLHCEQGHVWVTQDHCPQDHILEAGQRFEPDSPHRMLVHALTPSQVCLVPAGQPR